MRNFDERMDEIRSRSKARIAHRRKMITAVCTPLVLCLALSAVWFSAGNQIAYPTTLETTQATPQYHNTVSVVYVKDISTGEILCPAGSSEAFLAYVSKLDPVSNRTQQSGVAQHGFTATTGTPTTAMIEVDYYITVTDSLGNTTNFQLYGMTLNNLTTQESYALNSVEYKRLTEILSLGSFSNGE